MTQDPGTAQMGRGARGPLLDGIFAEVSTTTSLERQVQDSAFESCHLPILPHLCAFDLVSEDEVGGWGVRAGGGGIGQGTSKGVVRNVHKSL